jgi:hypothetical protein
LCERGRMLGPAEIQREQERRVTHRS